MHLLQGEGSRPGGGNEAIALWSRTHSLDSQFFGVNWLSKYSPLPKTGKNENKRSAQTTLFSNMLPSPNTSVGLMIV